MEKEATRYISPEKEVPDVETALQGARDIIAEQIAENADYKAWIREKTWDQGTIVTAEKKARAAKDDAPASKEAPGTAARRDVYEMYFEYEENQML